ncbi:MAG: hypothetical protein L7T19_05570 [Pseudomonadales bacterium]|jgi:hypothetical protein|nr:hypothetical protein [Pseudomonadales bacterium]
MILLALNQGCERNGQDPQLAAAEAFIDAFYSFEPTKLAAVRLPEPGATSMAYYQAWAAAANYRIHTRHPCKRHHNFVVCRITVTDDFGQTLGYLATDTFTLQMKGSMIVAANAEGDDPPIFNALFAWIAQQRPEILTGPCHRMFAGGTTPTACARAVADSAQIFINQ